MFRLGYAVVFSSLASRSIRLTTVKLFPYNSTKVCNFSTIVVSRLACMWVVDMMYGMV